MAVTGSPTASELLAEIAKAPPWFPSEASARLGAPRQLIDNIIDELRQARLIEARDWVKGKGQGYGLTAEGERVHAHPALLDQHLKASSSETLPLGWIPPTTFDRGERARNAYYYPPKPILTQILIAVTIAVFVLGVGLAGKAGRSRMDYLRGKDSPTLVKLGAVSGPALAAGEWWRLETANFVHIGLIHLTLNLYCLGLIGMLAESLWGRWRFLTIYLVSGFAGSALAMMIQPNSLLAGASGATWGLMTSLVVWLIQYRQHFEPGLVQDFARRLGFAIILNAAFSFVPGVSWEGHLGGAVGGVMMAIALDAIRPGYPRRTIAGILAAISVPLGIVAAFLFTATQSKPWRNLLANQTVHDRQAYLNPVWDDLRKVGISNLQLFVSRVQRTRENRADLLLKLEHQADDMLKTTAKLRESVPALPSPSLLIRGEPARLQRYLDAVDAVANAAKDYRSDDEAAFAKLRDACTDAETSWNDLFRNRWRE